MPAGPLLGPRTRALRPGAGGPAPGPGRWANACLRGAPGRTPFASRPGGCPPRPHDSRHKTALAVVLAVALLAGSWLIEHGAKDQKPPPQPSRAEAFPTPGEPLLGPRRDDHAVPPLPSAAPTRVRIPGIQVDAPMTPLTLGPDGTLTSPPEDDGNLAGWYAAGTPPGAAGTAVVAGHVDLANGPAVFYNLGALKKGDTVEVARADALTAVFTIDAIEVYDRSDFPSEKVYGTVGPPGHGRAELRVITCGGGFSAEADEYLGNVVVYAHLTGVRHPPGLLS